MRICFIAGEIDETSKKECIKFEIEKQIINFIEAELNLQKFL